MNAQEIFKQMYFDIWQSNDLNKFDDYYARDFQETIQFTDNNKQPIIQSDRIQGVPSLKQECAKNVAQRLIFIRNTNTNTMIVWV